MPVDWGVPEIRAGLRQVLILGMSWTKGIIGLKDQALHLQFLLGRLIFLDMDPKHRSEGAERCKKNGWVSHKRRQK
jgi:hypothetical protein